MSVVELKVDCPYCLGSGRAGDSPVLRLIDCHVCEGAKQVTPAKRTEWLRRVLGEASADPAADVGASEVLPGMVFIETLASVDQQLFRVAGWVHRLTGEVVVGEVKDPAGIKVLPAHAPEDTWAAFCEALREVWRRAHAL
jgi:hypothetical protein